MSIYIKNSGFTKTSIEKNNKKSKNEIKWMGDYNGIIANIDVSINDDGHKEQVNMKLDNNDLMHLLGIQPVNMSLEDRLTNDFLNIDSVIDEKDQIMVLNPLIKRKKLSKKIKQGKKVKQGKKGKKSKKRVI